MNQPIASAPCSSWAQQHVVRQLVSPTLSESSSPLAQKQQGPMHSFPFFRNGRKRLTSVTRDDSTKAPPKVAPRRACQGCVGGERESPERGLLASAGQPNASA